MSGERNTFVYRCYSSEWELLYVGRTRKPLQRRGYHRASATWFAEMSYAHMVGPLTHSDASELENYLIWFERPRANKTRIVPFPMEARSKWARFLDEVRIERVKQERAA